MPDGLHISLEGDSSASEVAINQGGPDRGMPISTAQMANMLCGFQTDVVALRRQSKQMADALEAGQTRIIELLEEMTGSLRDQNELMREFLAHMQLLGGATVQLRERVEQRIEQADAP